MNIKVKPGSMFRPVISVLVGLVLGLALTGIAGENPIHILGIMANSAFGSSYDLGMSLFYATPLIFTGLSVAVAFQGGLFNIGAEGQLAIGAFAAAAVGILYPNIPVVIAPVLATLAAFLAGSAWGAIPGWLRAKRGSHEVITTIMLNFIAAGLCSWATLYLFPNVNSQNPETTAVGSSYLLQHFSFFGGAPIGFAIILALIVAAGISFFLNKTALGFELRAMGQNETAARTAGIGFVKIRVLSIALAGGLAGLVGVSEVLGNAGRFKLGFSPGYGYMGIAVALLGRSQPLGVVIASLLFGALHQATAELDLETEHVTRDLSLILQALVILSVSADGLWNSLLKKKGTTRATT